MDSHNQFLTFKDFTDKFCISTTFLDYAGIIAAIPKLWKDAFRSGTSFTNNQERAATNKVVTPKKIRLLLAEKSFFPPVVERYLEEQKLKPKEVYELPFKITIENKLRSFQFKLTHNLIPTNQLLFKMKIKTSHNCERCESPNETISHIFYDCCKVSALWKLVIQWWNRKRLENMNPNRNEILYGYKPEYPHYYAFNHFLLIAKYYIHLARIKSELLNINVFLALLQNKIQSEKEIAVRNNAYETYKNKWTTLSNCDF